MQGRDGGPGLVLAEPVAGEGRLRRHFSVVRPQHTAALTLLP
ncbi:MULTISPECIES: hypothetical protein [Streptomyces]